MDLGKNKGYFGKKYIDIPLDEMGIFISFDLT